MATITRTPLTRCSTRGCPFTPDEHDEWMALCSRAPEHGHRHDQLSHQHWPKKGMGGNNPKSKVVAVLCWPLHDRIDNKDWGNEVFILPGGSKLYRAWTLHNETVIERVLACDGAEPMNVDGPEQSSALSQAGEGQVSIGGPLEGQLPPSPVYAGPVLTALQEVGGETGPALMDGEGESEASVSGLMRLESTALSPARGESLPRPPSPFSLEDWTKEGERLLTVGLQLKGLTDEWRYRIGDWVTAGEQNLGEEAYGHFSRFEDAFGASQLRQLGWVAASVTRATRELALSWSHARAIAALPESDQRAALVTAKEEGLSTRELSALVRPTPAEREPCICPTCQTKHYPPVSEEWK